MINRIVCAITTALASPLAIVAVPLACVGAARLLSETALTLVLSIMAISITQLVLRSGDQDTRALQLKLDEMIRATAAADDSLIGIERDDRHDG